MIEWRGKLYVACILHRQNFVLSFFQIAGVCASLALFGTILLLYIALCTTTARKTDHRNDIVNFFCCYTCTISNISVAKWPWPLFWILLVPLQLLVEFVPSNVKFIFVMLYGGEILVHEHCTEQVLVKLHHWLVGPRSLENFSGSIFHWILTMMFHEH